VLFCWNCCSGIAVALLLLVKAGGIMKPVKKYAWPLVLVLSIAFWMSACGKKQDETVNAKIRGNIATDGLTASSEGTINGQLLRVSVNRIAVTQNTGTGNNWGWVNPNTQSPVVSIDVVVNGQTQSVQYPVNPSSFNTGNAWQWTGANTMMATQVGGFQLWFEARCDTLVCENMWVNLVFSGNAYYGQPMNEAKQIGLYRVNSQNRLAAVLEMTTSYNQTLPTNQLIQELNAISQQ
jgi:hypothetical protein